ncbi:MAG: hypothetical protein OQK69_01390 [Gammaproteobacteria bacterium]|nr:hypothetical protein [Gammaproteobacteria bacterium]
MRKAILKRVMYEMTCIASLVFVVNVHADDAANQQAMTMASGWIVSQQNNDGSWGVDQNIRFSTTATVVDALEASNQYNSNYYAGLAWLENHDAVNVDYLSHRIQVLDSHGNNTQVDLDELHNSSQLTQDGWGLSGIYTSSTLDTSIALGALIKSDDTIGQTGAIDYLLASQNIDGGWSLQNVTVSDYWVTAHTLAVIELLPSPTPEVETAISNAVSFLSTITGSASDLAISQTILALHRNQGLTPTVDALITELLSSQMPAGDWGDVYTTATSMRALSAALGTDVDSYSVRAGVTDQTLRSIINGQLDKNAYDNLVQGEILQITSLDLRATDVVNLNGLENASNLIQIWVNAGTDTSAISDLVGSGVTTIIIDSDIDDIADASDNCPTIPNTDQANFDDDAYGDLCDDDIDGDGFTVAQGDLDDYDPNVYPIIVVMDGDVNGDSVISIADILLTERHVLGNIALDADSITRGDLYPSGSGDGVLTIHDLILLKSLVLGN